MSDWFHRQLPQAGPADAVAWGVGLLALAVYALPHLCTVCGVVLLRHTVRDDPRLAEPDDADPDYDGKAGELVALGFTPAGAVRERAYLQLHNLRKTFTSRYYQSADGRTLAALFRLFPNGLVRVSLLSLTPAGRLVRTVMPGVGESKRGPDEWREERPWHPLAGLVAEHETHATAAGGAVPATLAEVDAADLRVSRRDLAGIGWVLPAATLLLGWAVPFVGMSVLAWALVGGPLVHLLSFGFVAATAGYPLLVFGLLDRLLGADDHADAAERGGAMFTGCPTRHGVAAQEVGENGVYVLTVLAPVESAGHLPGVLADVRDAVADYRKRRPDGKTLLTLVADRPLWDAAEAAVRAELGGAAVEVGLHDGSDAPAREFELAGASG